MIFCTECGCKCNEIFKCVVDPKNDKFKCIKCGNIQKRYAGTMYETEKEREKRLSGNKLNN